ncbi:hypothetical protein RFI_35219, partial [Reticulomyxa filosa]
ASPTPYKEKFLGLKPPHIQNKIKKVLYLFVFFIFYFFFLSGKIFYLRKMYNKNKKESKKMFENEKKKLKMKKKRKKETKRVKKRVRNCKMKNGILFPENLEMCVLPHARKISNGSGQKQCKVAIRWCDGRKYNPHCKC